MNGSSGKWLLHRSLLSSIFSCDLTTGLSGCVICWGEFWTFWLDAVITLWRCQRAILCCFGFVHGWTVTADSCYETHTDKSAHTLIQSWNHSCSQLLCSSRTISSDNTHSHTHICERETRTVTPDLAGSEGHRGIQTKLPSNKHTALIISTVSSCVALTTSKCGHNEYVERWQLFCTWLAVLKQKCVKSPVAT